MDWYPRNSGKALEGMKGLTLEQRGAYNTLLDLIYMREGPISDDSRWLAGHMGVSVRKWGMVRASLISAGRIYARMDRKGAVLGDELADEKIATQRERRRVNEINGRLGGTRASTKATGNKENNDIAEATAQARLKLREIDIKTLPSVESAREDRFEDLFMAVSPTPEKDVLDVLARLDQGEPPAEKPAAVKPPRSRPMTRRLEILAQSIFDAAGPAAQARCNEKGGVPAVWRALRKAEDAGKDASMIASELTAYYQHPEQSREEGRFATAPHSAILYGKWETWRDETFGGHGPVPSAAPAQSEAPKAPIDPEASPVTVIWEGYGYEVPPGKTTSLVGTPDDPGPRRQISWMEDWMALHPGLRRFNWRAENGPCPGDPGCRVWPSVAKRFGEDGDIKIRVM